MRALYLLAALGAAGFVNAVDPTPGSNGCAATALPATLDTPTAGANKACICPSTQRESAFGTCAVITGLEACAPVSTATTQAGTVSLKDLAVTATREGTSADVSLAVKLPAMTGRKFLKVAFTTPGATDFTGQCYASQVFKTFAASATPTGCFDTWTITAAVSQLFSCGLTLAAVDQQVAGYRTYDGNIKILYEEPIKVGADAAYLQDDARQVTFDVPVRIKFQSQYTAELDTEAKVYTAYSVEWAIVDQNIPKVDVITQSGAGGSAELRMAYTVQYPYAIASLDSVQKGAWASGALTAQASPFGVVIKGATTGATSASPVNVATHCTLGTDYLMYVPGLTPDTATQTGDAALSTCYKKDNYLEFSGLGVSSACKFGDATDPYYYTVAWTMDCGSGVAAADCPLALNSVTGANNAVTADNHVTFGVQSEDFCIGSTANTDTIGPITITGFKAVSPVDYTAEQLGWRYGDKLCMRIDWNGVALNQIYLTTLKRKWAATTVAGTNWADITATTAGANAGDEGFWTSGSSTSNIDSAGDFFDRDSATPVALGASTAAGTLGLQSNGLGFWFTLALNDKFLGTYTPARGETRYLQVQATLDLQYTAARRRRRQAAATPGTASGAIQSTEQQITAPETAAVAPNSGVRAAPAVALVLAILSAVALL